MPGEMAARIVALSLLCFFSPNPGLGSRGISPQRQTFASTYSKVALSAVVSTSVMRTGPVMVVSAKPPVYVEPNENISSVSTKESTSLFTKALTPSAVSPPLNVDEASSSFSSVILNPEASTSATAASTKSETKMSPTTSVETSAFTPSKPMPHTATKTQSRTVIVTTSSRLISGSPHVSESPTSSPPTPSRKPVDYKLILCVAVPLFAVLVFVIVISMVLCIRRYRKLRRYRQHLVPLTDMDGSDDSDEDEQIGDKEPVFMVSSVSSSARPILSFENEND